mgnify:CR=1 FL=1
MDNQLKVSIGHYTHEGRKKINQDFHDILIPNEPQLTNKGIADMPPLQSNCLKEGTTSPLSSIS